jgi:acetoin utilization protein AcuC
VNNKQKPIFIYSQELEKYAYPSGSMFDTQRTVKTRSLLKSLGLLAGDCGREEAPERASITDMLKFHSKKYLEIFQQAARGNSLQEALNMGIGTPDCPVFKDMLDYASWACGASLTGVDLILSGETNIAFNPSGGFHHAKAEKAAGFCYINDLVLACIRFLENNKRVLYLDIDAHHGDGVQDAFYSSNEVMVISLHESGKTLFPWTGYENETGAGPGMGYNVNIPLPVGICDEAYLKAFTEIVVPLIKAFAPDVFVMQLGMDALAGDALAHLELTNNAHAEIVDRILSFDKPILATGGGGYQVENTVRGWALAWKIMCGQENGGDLSLGIGGTMLQSTEWSGGLRDRILALDEGHCEAVDTAVDATVQYLIQNVFPYHSI